MLLNPVKSKQQKEIIKDEILQHNKIRWPERGQIPVSEFKVEFLATMAFQTLFPDSNAKEIPLTREKNVMLLLMKKLSTL